MRNMIVCPEPLAAEVGESIFARGGNAMDAAIAAAFAQSVSNPFRCGLGGTGILYYYDAAIGQSYILNFEVTVGSRPAPERWAGEIIERSETVGRYIIESNENHVGYKSVMTPGFVRGCWEAVRRFGSQRISWTELLAPSITLAKEGFEVYPYITSQWQGEDDKSEEAEMLKIFEASEEAQRIFLKPDGSLPEVGDRLIQDDLAETIRRLSIIGGDDFNTGDIAKEISDDFEQNGGLLTKDDLVNFPVDEYSPISVSYRGQEVSSAPFGSGVTILQMLNTLNHFDIARMGHNTPEYIDTCARVFRACFIDYAKLKGLNYGEVSEIEKMVLSTERAELIARKIKKGDRIFVQNGKLRSGTTHLVSTDQKGNVVSLNHSVGSRAGSGVVTPGLGFLYNNFLCHFNPMQGQVDSIEPGKRFIAGPPVVVFSENKPMIIIGASGGSRINSSTAQCILNVIDHDMNMGVAVSADRFHSEEGQNVLLEPEISESIAHELRVMGNDIARSNYMAVVQAIRVRHENNELEAGPDPRGGAGVGSWPH